MKGSTGIENDFVMTKINEGYTRLFPHRKKADLHPCQTSKMEFFEKIVMALKECSDKTLSIF